jgi:FG-GAP-like repeat/FG-GAP repeat
VRVIGVVAAVLALAGAARAGVVVGVNDDAAKNAGQVGWLYPALGAEGLQDDAITLRWDDTAPATIPDEDAVSKALDLAAANGVAVELDLFPLHSQVFTGAAACVPTTDPEGCGDTAKIQQFAKWVGDVAQEFPTVHEFVVMNECNQPLFVNPQWDQSGQNQSAEICGRALAASYDALKSADPRNFVWGVGLSPRGNDNPNAASNSSTSPVLFLHALGAWYRSFAAKTGRTKPLMDGLDFHPYPIPQSQPFALGYPSANDASVSNLPRIYQAFYDGFSGTAQPTIGQQAGGGLPLSLNEVGVQTDSTGHAGYVGTETSANAAGGVVGQFATEAYQADWYRQMLDLLACDPNVRVVNIYHLIDEAALSGWQSGLYYLDRTPKASAATVHDWIADTGGGCQGLPHPWTPPGVAARPTIPQRVTPSRARVVVGVGGRVRIFDASTHALRRVLAPFGAGYIGPLAVALGAWNHDGVADIAVAQGAGSAGAVKVLDGKTGKPVASYYPFPASFRGGATVALGDVTGDGRADVVVGSGPGTPAQVKVYDSATRRSAIVLSPFARTFRGGVSVATADVNGDGHADLIAGSGAGMQATVAIFDGATTAPLDAFSPFPSFRGGVSVTAARLAAGGPAVVVGSGSGTTAVVRAFAYGRHTPLWSVDAFAPTFTGGASVAAGVLGGSGPSLVLGAGAGGGAQVKVLDGATHLLDATFLGAPGSAAVSVAAG